MKKISLTQWKCAIIDDEYYEEIAKHKWYYHHKGYAVRNVYENGIWIKMIFMHRQIKGGKKEMQCDHINGNRLDNRKSNLRFATNSENQRNKSKKSATCSSKFKGVYWDAQAKKFRVRIYINKTCLHIGRFDNEIEAANAYDDEAKKIHGEFARLNFP